MPNSFIELSLKAQVVKHGVKYCAARRQSGSGCISARGPPHHTTCSLRITNPPGMGGRLPEFNSISCLPPDVARR